MTLRRQHMRPTCVNSGSRTSSRTRSTTSTVTLIVGRKKSPKTHNNRISFVHATHADTNGAAHRPLQS